MVRSLMFARNLCRTEPSVRGVGKPVSVVSVVRRVGGRRTVVSVRAFFELETAPGVLVGAEFPGEVVAGVVESLGGVPDVNVGGFVSSMVSELVGLGANGVCEGNGVIFGVSGEEVLALRVVEADVPLVSRMVDSGEAMRLDDFTPLSDTAFETRVFGMVSIFPDVHHLGERVDVGLRSRFADVLDGDCVLGWLSVSGGVVRGSAGGGYRVLLGDPEPGGVCEVLWESEPGVVLGGVNPAGVLDARYWECTRWDSLVDELCALPELGDSGYRLVRPVYPQWDNCIRDFTYRKEASHLPVILAEV